MPAAGRQEVHRPGDLRSPSQGEKRLAKAGQLPVGEGQFETRRVVPGQDRRRAARPGAGQAAQEAPPKGRPAGAGRTASRRLHHAEVLGVLTSDLWAVRRVRHRPSSPTTRKRWQPIQAADLRRPMTRRSSFTPTRKGTYEVALVFVYDPKAPRATLSTRRSNSASKPSPPVPRRRRTTTGGEPRGRGSGAAAAPGSTDPAILAGRLCDRTSGSIMAKPTVLPSDFAGAVGFAQ